MLNTENIISICKLFKPEKEINAYDIENVITLEFEVFESERKTFSKEKRNLTFEARKIRGLTGDEEENERRKREAIMIVKKRSTTFGDDTDNEVLYKELGIGRNTLYRYIREIKSIQGERWESNRLKPFTLFSKEKGLVTTPSESMMAA